MQCWGTNTQTTCESKFEAGVCTPFFCKKWLVTLQTESQHLSQWRYLRVTLFSVAYITSDYIIDYFSSETYLQKKKIQKHFHKNEQQYLNVLCTV